MSNMFTPEQVSNLSAEIELQLQELRNATASDQATLRSGELDESTELPAKQSQAIAKVTQEDPKTFMQKFWTVAKKDLCEEGGVLYTQWQKWTDLKNEAVIDRFTAILVGLGFAGIALEILVVSTAVIVIHLGAKTFCEYYAQ